MPPKMPWLRKSPGSTCNTCRESLHISSCSHQSRSELADFFVNITNFARSRRFRRRRAAKIAHLRETEFPANAGNFSDIESEKLLWGTPRRGFPQTSFLWGKNSLFPETLKAFLPADFCVSKKRKEENEVFLKPFALFRVFRVAALRVFVASLQ